MNKIKLIQGLNEYAQISKRIEARADELERLSKMLRFDRDGRIEEVESNLRREIEQMAEARHNVVKRIEAVSGGVERTILELRYLNGWTWARIAAKLHYSRQGCLKAHRRALKQLLAREKLPPEMNELGGGEPAENRGDSNARKTNPFHGN